MPTTGMPTSASVPGSSMNGASRGTTAETSSPSMQATFESLEAEFARDLDGALGRRARVGGAHVGDDRRAGRAAGRQQRAHAALELRVIAARGIGHAVAMAEGHGALAEAFQHDGIELAALDQIDRRLEPVGGKAGAGADPESETTGSWAGRRSVALERADSRGRTGRRSCPARS